MIHYHVLCCACTGSSYQRDRFGRAYASKQGLKPEEISIQIPLKGVICEFVNGQSDGGSVDEYYLQSLPAIKLDMLAEATKNAQVRADKIASSTGARIGRVESANMGVFQVTTVNSTDISDYGTYDTTSINKKVTAIVRTDFLLE